MADPVIFKPLKKALALKAGIVLIATLLMLGLALMSGIHGPDLKGGVLALILANLVSFQALWLGPSRSYVGLAGDHLMLKQYLFSRETALRVPYENILRVEAIPGRGALVVLKAGEAPEIFIAWDRLNHGIKAFVREMQERLPQAAEPGAVETPALAAEASPAGGIAPEAARDGEFRTALLKAALYGLASVILGVAAVMGTKAWVKDDFGAVILPLAWLTGCLVRLGSGGRGGRVFQTLSVILVLGTFVLTWPGLSRPRQEAPKPAVGAVEKKESAGLLADTSGAADDGDGEDQAEFVEPHADAAPSEEMAEKVKTATALSKLAYPPPAPVVPPAREGNKGMVRHFRWLFLAAGLFLAWRTNRKQRKFSAV